MRQRLIASVALSIGFVSPMAYCAQELQLAYHDAEAASTLPAPAQTGDLWQRIRAGLQLEELDSPLTQAHVNWYAKAAGLCRPHARSLAPAGKLIDDCGLKGVRSGSAMISEDHANFILNTGGARSRDVLHLMNRARACVKKKFGVVLETEIKIWK